MRKLAAWLQRAFCDHRLRLKSIRRLDNELVVCQCHLCGAVLTARYGAALNGRVVPEVEGNATLPSGWCTLGIGSGNTGLFVHGPYEAIKECQRKLLARVSGDTPEGGA